VKPQNFGVRSSTIDLVASRILAVTDLRPNVGAVPRVTRESGVTVA
jgi:hypothetical protein